MTKTFDELIELTEKHQSVYAQCDDCCKQTWVVELMVEEQDTAFGFIPEVVGLCDKCNNTVTVDESTLVRQDQCRHYALFEKPTYENLVCFDCGATLEPQED